MPKLQDVGNQWMGIGKSYTSDFSWTDLGPLSSFLWTLELCLLPSAHE
jgi:hypothetical protein